jgi:hypothetical protein
MSDFSLFVGIDYSGAQIPTARLKNLQVYAATPGAMPEPVMTPSAVQALATGQALQGARQSTSRYWSRAEVAQWIIGLVRQGEHALIGIDHGFSFPESYFQRYGLADWNGFLADFCHHWPTDGDNTHIDGIRERQPAFCTADMQVREGRATDLRLCEKWTSSAKSVFHFDVQGSVAKSTHAGIPWLARIRRECGNLVHFWPFDGWLPPENRTVIAEIYPSVFRNRYARGNRSVDEQDAYACARWLAETDSAGHLSRYFDPPLTRAERAQAGREGWILGIA